MRKSQLKDCRRAMNCSSQNCLQKPGFLDTRPHFLEVTIHLCPLSLSKGSRFRQDFGVSSVERSTSGGVNGCFRSEKSGFWLVTTQALAGVVQVVIAPMPSEGGSQRVLVLRFESEM
jgi:hypothetical protein